MEDRPRPVSDPGLVPMRVRYGATCILCGTGLPVGADALYHRPTKTFRCVRCPAGEDNQAVMPVDAGSAGASALREYRRRTAKHEADLRERFGDRLGKVITVLTKEPQSTRAWAVGARGEQELAAAIAQVAPARVLHDRRVPDTQGNIDHLVIAPAGVFVVDAKRLEGRIEVRDVAPLFSRDLRLFVGGRDRSKLADGLAWQVRAVTAVLQSLALPALPPITPVLCFVDAGWPLFRPPGVFRGVRLEGPRSLRDLLVRDEVLEGPTIDVLTGILARAFPKK